MTTTRQAHAFDDRGFPLDGKHHPEWGDTEARPLVPYEADFRIEGDVLYDWMGNTLWPPAAPDHGTADTLAGELARRSGPNNTVLKGGKVVLAGTITGEKD